MKVLITGAGGMLGRDLIRVLSKSHELFGIGRKKRQLKNVKYFVCDLLDPISVSRCVKKIQPQAVIHTAAKTQVDDCQLKPMEAYLENVLATQSMLRAVRPFRPLFIYISTDYVFDGKKKSAYREGDSVKPLNVYGATKWCGERLVEESGCPWVILRSSWLYGQHGPNFVRTILKLARTRKSLCVVTDQRGAPTFTRDLALAIERLLQAAGQRKRIQGIYHLTNRGVTNWNQYAKRILKEAGRNHLPVLAMRTKDSDRPALRPANSCLNNDRFNRKFGYEMRPWQEALSEFMKGSSS